MAKAKKAEAQPVVLAYKGFNKNLVCRDFQYEIGKTYEHAGKVEACAEGFHACENPVDVFTYYTPSDSRFCVVELSGELSRHESDSKIAAGRINIKAEISIPEIVTKTIEWVTALCKPADAQHATGNQSASSATGNQSASSATGYRSASSATGYRSASSATGNRSASSATGNQSASSATGDWSASSATGNQSASSATGDWSASSATGYRSASSATGKAAVALNTGLYGKAKASEDGAIVLCNHDDNGNISHIRASKVGENGIQPDVFYVLNDAGEFEVVP
jgi:hypothetical protein